MSKFTLLLPGSPQNVALIRRSREARNLLERSDLEFDVNWHGDGLEPRLLEIREISGSNLMHIDKVYDGLEEIKEFAKNWKKNQDFDPIIHVCNCNCGKATAED